MWSFIMHWVIYQSTDLVWKYIFAHMYIFCFSVIFKMHQHWSCHRHFEWAVTLYLNLHGSLGDISSTLYLNNWLPVIWTYLLIQLFTCLWFHKRKLVLFKAFDADVLEWSIWTMLTCWFSSTMFTFWPLYLYMRTCTGRYIFIRRTEILLMHCSE